MGSWCTDLCGLGVLTDLDLVFALLLTYGVLGFDLCGLGILTYADYWGVGVLTCDDLCGLGVLTYADLCVLGALTYTDLVFGRCVFSEGAPTPLAHRCSKFRMKIMGDGDRAYMA